MLRVGLTGGIGSGKTTVSEIFQTIGIPVYNADHEAKQLMNNDAEIRSAIINAFGEESYKGTVINRSFLISNVFYDEQKLATLNSIVHPATIADAQKWMTRQSGPYALKEAAIIFETGADQYLDYVIGVTAPEQLRIDRLMKRDNRTKEEVREWMSRQMDEKEKISKCNFVIHNDEQQMLIPQVLALHEKLLQLSKDSLHIL